MEAGTEALPTAGQAVEPIELEPIEVTEEDVATIGATQGPMPVVPEPYAPAAERLGVSQEDVLRRLESLRERGGLRRVAAILYHRRAGFSANGMGVWKVPDAEILETGKRMAAFRGVSHCYQRPTYADWPYSRLHDGPRALEGGVRRHPRLDRRGDRHQRAGDAVLLDRVQEGPDALLHRRLPALGGGAGLTTSISDVRSAELYRRALHVLPGGVNSPVRAMRSIGRDPIFIERAEGAEIIDVDGNTYVDYVCSWGPLILGHAHPAVLEAVADAAARGTTFGAPTVGEVELAELVGARMPAVDMLRMTSSGTEASMSALRLARAATGREKVLKFAGAYHGHVDGLLAEAGSGLATQGIPASPGVPEAADGRDRRGPLERRGGGAGGVRRARAGGGHLRALPGQHGPRPAGLRLPRAAARAGDRARGAADLRRGDLGLPDRARRRAGADRRLAGPDRDGQDPRRRAARGRVRRLDGADGADRPGRRRLPGRHAEREPARRRRGPGDARAARRGGLPRAVVHHRRAGRRAGRGRRRPPGLGRAHHRAADRLLRGRPADDYAGAAACDTQAYGAWCRALLARGVYPPPSQFEAWFPSLAHTREHVTRTVEAAAAAFAEIA